MARKIVRVDVDTQVGFADKDGGLYVKGAEQAIPAVVSLNKDAEYRGFPILGSVDTHEAHSPEFKVNGGIWPIHCVKGTRDWLKLPETLPSKYVILGDAPIRPEKTYAKAPLAFDPSVAVYFEKDVYSLFDNVNAEGVVAHYANQGYEFQVYGIATDYCVAAAALGIKQRHPNAKVTVILDACMAVAEESRTKAVDDMEKAGIEFAYSTEILSS